MPKTGENRTIAEKQLRKLTNGREEQLNKNSDAASGTIFRIGKTFKEASKNFLFIFLFKKAS
jgi:hypothetical protein